MIIQDALVLKKKDDVIERFGEELLLFDSSTGTLFEVTDIGKTIWELLNRQYTVAEIKNYLKDEFPDVQTIDSDVHDFLTKLHGLDLIEPLQ
jgi:hypothetical protein